MTKTIFIAVIASLLLIGPAPALQVDGKTITLDDAEVQNCREGGGRMLMSRETLLKSLQHARDQALAGGRVSCGNRT